MRPTAAVVPVVAGQLRIKRAQVHGLGPLGLRHLWTMLDPRWSEVRPVYCWVLDLPAATVLVDTGPRATTAWRWPRYHPYYPLAYRTREGPHGGLLGALDAAGYAPDDIDAVVLSHVHPDHAEGLKALPAVPVYLPDGEVRLARSLRGRLWGSHPSLVTSSTRVHRVVETDEPVGPFDRSGDLPWSGVSLVPTPGHTAHHHSIVVTGAGPPVVLAADACLSLAHLESHRVDGVATRPRAGRDTLERLDRWHREGAVVLPSHDHAGAEALAAAR